MVWKALPRLKIAVACTADWNAMVGDDTVRSCGQCCQNVYNVRNLRPREVAALIERHGERMPCLRLYHRPDGTVVTRSCLAWARTGVLVMRWSIWKVAVLAIGFWSQVLLWHAKLHPRSDELTLGVKLVPARTLRVPGPPPPPLREYLRGQTVESATMGAMAFPDDERTHRKPARAGRLFRR